LQVVLFDELKKLLDLIGFGFAAVVLDVDWFGYVGTDKNMMTPVDAQ